MDASGGDQLLGKSELSRLDLLIRETAQNSWDARLPNTVPLFGVSLRRTDTRYREDLGSLFSDGQLDELRRCLGQANFRVLEVFDRGTYGLDGPSDLSPAYRNQSARFQDLILKFGVSHNDGKTGGTYGFGKTAAFAFSGVGTIVYWTRCRSQDGEIEDRFIASSFGRSYQQDGVQYTGRHWWGVRDEGGDSVLPVVGSEAARLGNQFFSRGFEAGETGTSLLILDPLVTDDNVTSDVASTMLDRYRSSPADVETDFGRRARHSIRANLWPKLIPFPGAVQCPMDLQLEVNGIAIPLEHPNSGTLGYWGAGLQAIREHRSGSRGPITTPADVPVKVIEVTRYKEVIGHLSLVKRIPALEQTAEYDDLDPSRSGTNIQRIALMRGKAELVVTTVDWVDRMPIPGMDWLAVYKSSDDFEEAYAQAEPPAHDRWVSDGASNESAKIIRHTKNRVKRLITEEFYPERDDGPTSAPGSTVTAGRLARKLGAMLPGEVDSPAADGRQEGIRRSRRSTGHQRKWSIEADTPRLLGTDSRGCQRQEVAFRIYGRPGFGIVTLTVSLIGEDGLHEPVPVEDLNTVWIGGARSLGQSAWVQTDAHSSVQFSGAPRRAMRVELNVGDVNGDT